MHQKINNKTQPFVFCGRLEYVEYERDTANPVHIIFRNIDYVDDTENEDLLEVYKWKPGQIGKSTKSKISKKGGVSDKQKSNYKKPTETKRQGLVTSRAGQGYYRSMVLEKWGYQCAVTGFDNSKILIASHIVPWRDAGDDEHLDP